jgi:class 3 adenylate cyclase
LDLVFIPGLSYPIDLLWEDPGFTHLVKRLRGFSRTMWYEGRGHGASGGDYLDRHVDAIASADLTTMLNDFGCDRVALVGASGDGSSAIAYAASHPERVTALVLLDSFAHYVRESDYSVGVPPDFLERYVALARQTWGTGAQTEVIAPSKIGDEGFRARLARCERLGLSPEDFAASIRSNFRRDLRPLLPTITIPTLVIHREGDLFIRVEAGRYVAEHIPDAKYVELPGNDHMFWVGDINRLVDEVEEFLTGAHQAPEGDVVTATILFTDIVSSTEQSGRLGHRKWSALTDAHDAMVRATLKSHRGREVKTTGDGFLATFDATSRAVRAAKEIVTAAKGMGLHVRAGVHTGEVEIRLDDVIGLAVTIAKRICDFAGPDQVLVSETVKGLIVGSGIALSAHGTEVLKGVPDEWRLFVVEG